MINKNGLLQQVMSPASATVSHYTLQNQTEIGGKSYAKSEKRRRRAV